MEISRQLNAEKIVLCRQTASGRYTLTDGFTIKTYMYFSYFSTPSTWHCHFKQSATFIQHQSIWLCSSTIPFPTVCLNHSLYCGNCRDWTQFPETLSMIMSAFLPSAQLLHTSTCGGSSSFLPRVNGSYRISCAVMVKQADTGRRG